MEPEKKLNGSFVGLIIIIIILVIGGIYIWISNKKAIEERNSQAQSEAITEQDAAALNALEQDSNTIDTNAGVDVDSIK
ncbi:hypothetical protein A3A03_00030 [Candidatus Nomurabacteria bacterium RIFCSPLOWO2_01_FULL_40_18]|uniref:Uncharacterized protein n=1 Tax=Candidatus Nomurabacteria bacterium RIFCSPLOWO2_01_FULL_40_18 TaxID=1801773 RepID=A0A1F6XKC7_9BACT|nr:MAG: hypothetical protein A3A03_00030 [Candidatus Nomurabacteria bacterium RIFCSPLOWO2_01_FULL_40_18]